MIRRQTQARNRRQPRGDIGSVGGFTLLELLLVLAILVMLTAMAWPTYEGFIADQRLHGAAEQFRNDLREARRRAIRNGATVRCSLAAGQTEYLIEELTDAMPSAVKAPADSANSTQNSDEPLVISLPLGVVFSSDTTHVRTGEGERLPDQSPRASAEPAGKSASRTPETAAPDRSNAEAPRALDLLPWVEFYPDGSATVGTIWLVDSRRHALEIRLDPLTGEASISEPVLPEVDQAASEPAEEP